MPTPPTPPVPTPPEPASSTSSQHPASTWVPWLLVMVLSSLVAGLGVGILTSLAGAGLPKAVLAGWGAFVGMTGICLATPAAVRELRKNTQP